MQEPELKMIPLDAKKFTANGVEYFIATSLSIERMAIRELMEIEFGVGASFMEVFNTLRDSYSLLNERRFADAAVLIHGTMNGIANAQKKEVSAVKLCTLFINAAGEDIGAYSEEMAAKKIEDWKAEGIDVKYFFQLAALSTKGFIGAFKELTLNTLITSQEPE